jgi:hypothetical protein
MTAGIAAVTSKRRMSLDSLLRNSAPSVRLAWPAFQLGRKVQLMVAGTAAQFETRTYAS